LIVDDEPNVRMMLRTALESVGYRVLEAADGPAALSQVQSMPCDLVLLDLRMPKMDGMETLRRLRAGGHAVPVVILTAHGSIPDAVTAMKLGAIDFLTKPITPQALRAAVADVIHRQVDEPAQHPAVASAKPADRSQSIAFDLARVKRALNRGEFDEAEDLLRAVIARDPQSTEANELLDRLLTLKEKEGLGSFRVLRDWFPSGAARKKP
jgi:DNA-binding response OmpR family regulator